MKKFLFGITALFAPAFALAGEGGNVFDTTNIEGTVSNLLELGDLAIAVLVAIAVIVFIYGIVKYIISGNDPEKRKDAGWYILFGIVAIAVIGVLWGLVNIVVDITGLSNDEAIDTPSVRID